MDEVCVAVCGQESDEAILLFPKYFWFVFESLLEGLSWSNKAPHLSYFGGKMKTQDKH